MADVLYGRCANQGGTRAPRRKNGGSAFDTRHAERCAAGLIAWRTARHLHAFEKGWFVQVTVAADAASNRCGMNGRAEVCAHFRRCGRKRMERSRKATVVSIARPYFLCLDGLKQSRSLAARWLQQCNRARPEVIAPDLMELVDRNRGNPSKHARQMPVLPVTASYRIILLSPRHPQAAPRPPRTMLRRSTTRRQIPRPPRVEPCVRADSLDGNAV